MVMKLHSGSHFEIVVQGHWWHSLDLGMRRWEEEKSWLSQRSSAQVGGHKNVWHTDGLWQVIPEAEFLCSVIAICSQTGKSKYMKKFPTTWIWSLTYGVGVLTGCESRQLSHRQGQSFQGTAPPSSVILGLGQTVCKDQIPPNGLESVNRFSWIRTR